MRSFLTLNCVDMDAEFVVNSTGPDAEEVEIEAAVEAEVEVSSF